MARPIEATPILYGEDARRFLKRMKEKRTETPEQQERRMRDYEACLRMLEAGKNVKMKKRRAEEGPHGDLYKTKNLCDSSYPSSSNWGRK